MESGLELDQVQEQLEALRREMSRLATALYRPRVSVSSRRPAPFLGQSVVIDVTVSDPRTGQGLADAPLILTTTRGVLRLAEGYQLQLGSSLSARTDADGNLQVTLLSEAAEFMSSRHQDALNATLGAIAELRPESATVGAVAERLARAYDWESNPDFREAADLLFAQQRQAPEGLERLNLLPDSWPSQDAAIGVHLLSRQEDGSCEGSALLQLRFRHWLSALVFQLSAAAETGSDLDGKLQQVLRVTRGAPDLMGAFQQQIYRFVNRRRGHIGRAVGSAVARGILDRFVTGGLVEQEPDLRRALDAGLRATRAALNEQGGQVLAGLGDLRQELHSQLGKEVGSKADLSAVEDVRREIDTRVGKLQVDLKLDLGARIGTLSSALEGLNGKLAAKAESAALEGLRGDLTARLKDSASALEGLRGDLTAGLKGAVSASAFEGLREELSAGLKDTVSASAFEGLREELSAGLKDTVSASAFADLRGDLSARFKDTVSARAFADFSRNHADQIDAQSGELKNLASGLASFQAETAKTLSDKVDSAAFVVLRFGLLNNIKDLARKVPNFRLLNSEILEPKLSSDFTPVREIDIDLGGVPIKIRPSLVTPVIRPIGG